MYKIRSQAEDRTYECDFQFAVYGEHVYGEGTPLYAVSFTGRPSPVQAIMAGFLMGFKRYFTLSYPEGEQYVYSDNPRVITDRVGDVYHAILLPKCCKKSKDLSGSVIVAPDGDLDKALKAWVCSLFAVPPELDYRKIFELQELDVVKNPECPQWKNLRAWSVNSTYIINEKTVPKLIGNALKVGMLTIPSSPVEGIFDPGMSLQEYLKANARIFAEKLNHVKPLHGLNEEHLNPAIVMDRIPFPVQAHTIQSLVKALERQNTAILCGEMGTGKSIDALGICNVLYNERGKKPTRVLLSAPGITIPKWDEKEIRETLPEAKVTIIHNTDDAARYLRKARENDLPDGLNFVLVGIDRAKLGPDPWCTALWRRIREMEDGKAVLKSHAWHCSSCGQWIPDPRLKKEEGEMPAGWTLFAAEPFAADMFNANGFPKRKIRWKLPARLSKCPRCGSPLWRSAIKTRGETRNQPRWYAADILKRLGKHFDLYVADEGTPCLCKLTA